MVKHLVFGSGASFLVSFVSLILVARIFSFDFISDIKAVALYGGLFAGILSLQVHSAFLYFYKPEVVKSKEIKIFAFFWIFLLSLSAGILFYFFFPIFYSSASLSPTGVFFFSISIVYNMLFIVTPTIFTATNNSTKAPFFMFMYSIGALLSLAIVFFLELNINAYSVIYVGIITMVFYRSIWREFFIFTVLNLGKSPNYKPSYFISYAKNLTFANFFESIGDKLDKIFASIFFSQSAFAKYSVLCFENPIVNILLNSFGIVLVKTFPNGVSKSKNDFEVYWDETIRSITFLNFPIAFFMFFNADWFIELFFGQRYIDGSVILQIYALVSIVRHAPFQALLRMEGLSHLNVVLSMAFVAISITILSVTIVFDYPLIVLPLSYMGGWIVFNFLAIYFFCRATLFGFADIFSWNIWIVRILQSLPIFFASSLIFVF